MIRNQLSMQEARKFFDYRDGMLFWRQAGSGHRIDRCAFTVKSKRNGGVIKYVRIGGKDFLAHYLVWNWHHGMTPHKIVPANGDDADVRIENLRDIEIITLQSRRARMSCPCCAQPVPVPTVPVIAETCGLTPVEAKILEVVWGGDGRAVQTEPIFNRMFEDHDDGGPTPAKMYLAFKVALSHMRSKLEGSGVSIENVGYRKGYRLIIGKGN